MKNVERVYCVKKLFLTWSPPLISVFFDVVFWRPPPKLTNEVENENNTANILAQQKKIEKNLELVFPYSFLMTHTKKIL